MAKANENDLALVKRESPVAKRSAIRNIFGKFIYGEKTFKKMQIDQPSPKKEERGKENKTKSPAKKTKSPKPKSPTSKQTPPTSKVKSPGKPKTNKKSPKQKSTAKSPKQKSTAKSPKPKSTSKSPSVNNNVEKSRTGNLQTSTTPKHVEKSPATSAVKKDPASKKSKKKPNKSVESKVQMRERKGEMTGTTTVVYRPPNKYRRSGSFAGLTRNSGLLVAAGSKDSLKSLILSPPKSEPTLRRYMTASPNWARKPIKPSQGKKLKLTSNTFLKSKVYRDLPHEESESEYSETDSCNSVDSISTPTDNNDKFEHPVGNVVLKTTEICNGGTVTGEKVKNVTSDVGTLEFDPISFQPEANLDSDSQGVVCDVTKESHENFIVADKCEKEIDNNDVTTCPDDVTVDSQPDERVSLPRHTDNNYQLTEDDSFESAAVKSVVPGEISAEVNTTRDTPTQGVVGTDIGANNTSVVRYREKHGLNDLGADTVDGVCLLSNKGKDSDATDSMKGTKDGATNKGKKYSECKNSTATREEIDPIPVDHVGMTCTDRPSFTDKYIGSTEDEVFLDDSAYFNEKSEDFSRELIQIWTSKVSETRSEGSQSSCDESHVSQEVAGGMSNINIAEVPSLEITPASTDNESNTESSGERDENNSFDEEEDMENVYRRQNSRYLKPPPLVLPTLAEMREEGTFASVKGCGSPRGVMQYMPSVQRMIRKKRPRSTQSSKSSSLSFIGEDKLLPDTPLTGESITSAAYFADNELSATPFTPGSSSFVYMQQRHRSRSWDNVTTNSEYSQFSAPESVNVVESFPESANPSQYASVEPSIASSHTGHRSEDESTNVETVGSTTGASEFSIEIISAREEIISEYKEITNIMRKATKILEEVLPKAEQQFSEKKEYLDILRTQKQAAILINEMLDNERDPRSTSNFSLEDFKALLKLTLLATKVLMEDKLSSSDTDVGGSRVYMELLQILILATETLQGGLDICVKRAARFESLTSLETQSTEWSVDTRETK